ncbi:hypothetical protein FALBO_1321 [Fusarium albosuccineum]|uniref:Uncharacterized protein n=1 Tax=Fusarium albosuccineum TaxID=1237068 RepID=A0A8H4LNG5_9HYPO|nr:hypothetical protein FALBO_1321 [Fusarium albosuccineum]
MATTGTITGTPALTSSFTTITSPAQLSYPHFTPPPDCLNSTNIWLTEDSCFSSSASVPYISRVSHTCKFFGLYPDNSCFPDIFHAATQCPEEYTSVDRTGFVDGDRTSRELICCPTTHNFGYGIVTLEDHRGSPASLESSTCIASMPPFSGRAPWTLTVSSWSTTSSSYTIKSTPVIRTVVFDGMTHLLMAQPVTISYVVDGNGKTCAPDCYSPWTGGEWPMPEPTHENPIGTSEPAPDDSGLGQIPIFIGEAERS